MTKFATVYNRFLGKVTDDMYVELTPEDTLRDLQNLLIDSIPCFEFPRKNLYDYIISNPPFSCKDEVLKRLYELDQPYAMLLPLPTLQGQKRFPYIKDCEALIFDKRVQYFKDIEQTEVSKGASFGSIYICKNFLPNDLIFKELKRK